MSTVAEVDILLLLKDKATAKIHKSLGKLDAQTKKSTSGINNLGKSLRKHWLAATAAIAAFMVIVRRLAQAVQAFAVFEKGLRNIEILMGENRDEIQLFERDVLSLSKQFGVTTNALLKSAFDIQSALGDTKKSLDILNNATKLAVAGGADMVDTTAGLITLMENYGHTLTGAADAADLLFKAQVRARATIAELSAASGTFLPLAAKLSISAEDALASFAKMTVVLGNVSESATAMNGILNGLIKPTTELKEKVEEWFGVSVQQVVAQGKFLELMERLGELSEEEIGQMIPRIRGLKGLLAVSQDINTVRKHSIEFEERTGIVQENLGIQMASTQKRLDILTASWHQFNIKVGEAIVEGTPLVSWMQKLANVATATADNIRSA